ncbi:hypothetical protein IV38_GL001097 [Lactobacillus selangorensis]|uniref:VOC domain-containing protein n=1 Tax=Lactobacillus selangorensis TaxID=81857 RepID=A0A0R2FJR9_9LACO|nr:VOC family protein [Lactobacillus selangorensis]KRN28889.1 hypothetical protein IV38_GL001097 [Lactobacillus selangorensis]KRN32701.1 hypothetical protein IV40_GL000756 [Lactobacillus selangorensis]
MRVRQFDELTLTVRDRDHSVRWYHEVFDLPIVHLADGRSGVMAGKQEIIFQTLDHLPTKTATEPAIGSAQFALIVRDKVEDVLDHFNNYMVQVVVAPHDEERAHGMATVMTIYDLDQNLIDIVIYHDYH